MTINEIKKTLGKVRRIKHKFLICIFLFSIYYVMSSLFNLCMTRYENIAYFDTVRAEISVQYEVPYKKLRMVVKRDRPSSEGQYFVRIKGGEPICLDDNEEIITKIENGIEKHAERRERADARLGRSIIFFAVISGIAYFRIWMFGVMRDIKKRLKKK